MPAEEENVSLQEQITEAWKAAMKARSSEKDILALMRTELKNKAIATREGGSSSTEVTDEVALGVFQKMAKQRKDSIEQYQAGGRDDLVAAETAELEVIQKYLPQPLSDDEIDEVIKKVMKPARGRLQCRIWEKSWDLPWGNSRAKLTANRFKQG